MYRVDERELYPLHHYKKLLRSLTTKESVRLMEDRTKWITGVFSKSSNEVAEKATKESTGKVINESKHLHGLDSGVKYTVIDKGPLSIDVARTFSGSSYTERLLLKIQLCIVFLVVMLEILESILVHHLKMEQCNLN